jgi:hypothetical protein
MPFDDLQNYLLTNLKFFASIYDQSRINLFSVWDEAQILLSQETNMFLSSDGQSKRPLYTALIRAHVELLKLHRALYTTADAFFSVVAMGTGLSLKQAEQAISSNVHKDLYSFNSVVISNGYDTPEDVLRYLKNYIPEVTIEIAALFVGRSRYSAMFVEHYISSLPRGNSLGSTALEYFNRVVSVMMEVIKNLPSKYPNLTEELESLENFLDDSIFNFLLVYNSYCAYFLFQG